MTLKNVQELPSYVKWTRILKECFEHVKSVPQIIAAVLGATRGSTQYYYSVPNILLSEFI